MISKIPQYRRILLFSLLFSIVLLTGCPDDPAPPEVTILNMTRTDGASTDDTISLSWETDTAADCTVHYGPYRFYGFTSSSDSDEEKTSHSVTLTSLEPRTSYDIKVATNPLSSAFSPGEQSNPYWEYATKSYSLGIEITVADQEVVETALGAFCFSDAGGYYGPFSSGVLLTSSWVLTAAHSFVVDTMVYGRVPAPANTVFYIGGLNADHGPGDSAPAEGGLYNVAEIVIHPDYDPETRANDIALVKLAGAVTGVEPAPRASGLPGSFDGETFPTTGFDVSLEGTKRKIVLRVDNPLLNSFEAYDDSYSSNLGTEGVILYGDIDGTSSVIGISSQYGTGAGSYSGRVIFSRVDQYNGWINGILSP